jgi:hypothetical protein
MWVNVGIVGKWRGKVGKWVRIRVKMCGIVGKCGEMVENCGKCRR